jgi:2-dehydro-3-deoxyphosphogluconate aldolase/(4S)-4-hydroxy-2-oxoglutarate aldolase
MNQCPSSSSLRMCQLIDDIRVIPVIVVDEVSDAVPLAKALCAGGLLVLEITLRTPAALASIEAVAKAVPEAVVGAGTVLNGDDARKAREAGAMFAVSPGYTSDVGCACVRLNLPLLPGVATASEVMTAMNDGYDFLKFFPAETAGGIPMLRSLAGPFPCVSFCPTGGIDAANFRAYLAERNVRCIGGSWLTPHELIRGKCWGYIQELASEVASLSKPST